MNLFKIIRELYEEKRRIDKAIEALDDLASGKAALPEEPSEQTAPPPKKRRGRPRKYPLPPPTS